MFSKGFQRFMEMLITFGPSSHNELHEDLVDDIVRIKKASSWMDFQTILQDQHHHAVEVKILNFYGYEKIKFICVYLDASRTHAVECRMVWLRQMKIYHQLGVQVFYK